MFCALVSASPSLAAGNGCRDGISRDTAALVFGFLDRPAAEPGCRLEGVGTQQSSLEAHWSRDGVALPPLRVMPAACAASEAPPESTRAGRYVVEVPPEIGARCPGVVPLVAAAVAALAAEPAGGGEVGSLNDPLCRGARALFAAILLVAAALSVRGLSRRRQVDPAWAITAIAGFSAALAIRAALPFSLANWYTEVLPAAGPPPWMRFGPGFFAFQSLLRDAGLWTGRALAVTQLVLGAAASCLLLAVLRELRVGLESAAAAVVLLAFSPLHARLSATASEHVLASTLFLAFLLSWLRAARGGDRLWFALALLLFPAACATRVDTAVPASVALLWPFLPDRIERADGRSARPSRTMAAMLAATAAVTLAGAYRFIAVPSHHPLPEAGTGIFALRASIGQMWEYATTEPRWISLPSVLLAAVGVVVMAGKRPLLLIRVAVTFLAGCVALGRPLLADQLLGARYHMGALPVLLVASGEGFAALLAPVPRRIRGMAAALGIVVLGVWAAHEGRGAYAVRYTFQDEYTLLRSALPALPAGCTVYAMPMRVDVFPRDLDCCLDVSRSPLVLDFPGLRFRALPEVLPEVFEESGCAAYYESAACRIVDDPADPSVHERAERAAEYLRQRCAAVRAYGNLAAVAETTASARATVDFFHGERPRIGLYRWTRPGSDGEAAP